MKIKNIICLIVCFCMILTVLCSCSGGQAASIPAHIGEDGRFIYSLIRGKDSSTTVEDGVKVIRSAIRENFDCKVSTLKDDVLEEVEGACEILIGDTNRAASAEAKKIVSEARSNNAFDFIVKVIDNQICIQAVNDDMIVVACEWFAQTFCKDLTAWSMLREEYEFLYQPETESNECAVAGMDLGLFTVVKPAEMSYIIGMEVDKFIDGYKKAGLTLNYIEDIDPAEKYEILIGNTTREESKGVTVEGDNYVIKVVGTKLVVKGGNDLATYRAMKYLNELVAKTANGEPINWTDGYVINGKYDEKEENTYTLNFFDDFNGSTLDLDVWGDYNYQAGRTAKSCLGGTNWYANVLNKSTAYGKDLPYKSVYVADGNLVMSTYKLNEKDFVGTYASTFTSMMFKYGVWEVRGKQSLTPGCMSYWLNGAGSQNYVYRDGGFVRACMTEIDLIETMGSQTWFAANVHRWGNDGVHNSMDGVAKYKVAGNNKSYNVDVEREGGDITENFHTYSMYWDDECMKFAFDGKVFVTYDYKQEESVSVHCLLNYINLHFRMGDATYGRTWKPEEHPDYVEAYIDNIKVYQTAELNSQMITGPAEFSGKYKQVAPVIKYPDNPVTGEY